MTRLDKLRFPASVRKAQQKKYAKAFNDEWAYCLVNDRELEIDFILWKVLYGVSYVERRGLE